MECQACLPLAYIEKVRWLDIAIVLVYTNLIEKRHKTKSCGEKVMQETAVTFQRRPNKLLGKVEDKDGSEHSVGIAPAPLHAMPHINDAWYLPGDTTLKVKWVQTSIKNNVGFLQVRCSSSPYDFGKSIFLSAQDLHSVVFCTKLLVHYEISTSFIGAVDFSKSWLFKYYR